jgi:hypothetical protein
MPLGKDRRFLQAIERAIDLNRRDLPTRVVELPTSRNFGGIESLAPGLEVPATDAFGIGLRLRQGKKSTSPIVVPADSYTQCGYGRRGYQRRLTLRV